ncbi:FGGY-family carbohydrate kinase [Niveibacterium sp.]|uniref:FGGY-family carbohydrate kinase n=1 Tax=Niveibacterium sp. TaxID=2017444 RepID=UPI0035AD9860
MTMPAPDDLLLSLDCGTQSVRALLFDLQGALVGKAQVHFDDYRAPQPGWLEHDAEGFWAATAQACRQLWASYGHLKPALRGVAVTTQRGTVIPIDAEGKALHPALIWLDQRKAQRVPTVAPWWRAAFKAAGVADTIRYFQREAEANWFAECEPALWAKTRKFLLLSGWLNFRLTGRHVDSVGAQVGYLPFDFKRLAWARSLDWKWQALALAPDVLPELLPVGATLGQVTRAAAADTGIPEGLPVIAAAADKACEILGAGALTPEVGALSYGTTATVNVTTRRYFEALPWVPPYPAAVPGQYSSEVQIFRGYWMVRWFKEQFGQAEQLAAEQAGIVPESLFDEMVATVPPGSMGLMLQPFWSPGIRHPGPDAKGAVIGFGDVHTKAHLYRAILEGLAYALRDGRERIEKKSGVAMRELRVSGGGSQSDAAMQLTADIFNLPTSRPHTYETSGLGAAIDCAVGLGLHRDFDSAVAAMTRVARTFEPIHVNATLYEALYTRVYRHMYERLAPLYAEIQRITGYPKLD